MGLQNAAEAVCFCTEFFSGVRAICAVLVLSDSEVEIFVSIVRGWI